MSSIHIFRKILRIDPLNAKQKKRRWFTRLDMIFWIMFVILMLAFLFISITGIGKTTPHVEGKGGTNITYRPAPEPTCPPGGCAPYVPPADIIGGAETELDQWAKDFGPVDSKKVAAINDPALMFLVGTRFDRTVNNDNIVKAWTLIVWGCTSVIGLLVVFYGYQIIFSAWGLRYAEAVETIPRIIISIIGVHASRYFVTFWIALNNILCEGLFTNVIKNITTPLGKGLGFEIAFTGLFGGLIQLIFAAIGKAVPALEKIPIIGSIFDDTITVTTILTPFMMMVAYILVFALYVQQIMRLALITVLTIISPMGMISWALPKGGGRAFFSLWANALIATIMVQFFQLLCYGCGLFIFGVFENDPSQDAMINLPGGINVRSADFSIFYAIAALWLALKMPSWFGNTVTNTMGSASGAVFAAVNQAVNATIQVASSVASAAR